MASTLESKVEERKDNNEKTVDREKTCPLLLRVFCSNGRHNNIGEYRRGNTPPNELQIYTWMDATLKEIGSLILEVNPDTRRRGTVFEFRLVYPELTKPIPRMKELGSIVIGQKGFDDNKTLAQLGCLSHLYPPQCLTHFPSGDLLFPSVFPSPTTHTPSDCGSTPFRSQSYKGFVIGDFLDIAITSPGRGMPPQRRMRPY